MKYINEIDLNGKKVFIRADLNVPFAADGSIADDTRIKAALPNITMVLDAGGCVILSSHLGRPKGKVVPEMSLAPVAQHLESLLGSKVIMAPDCIGPEVEQLASALKPGEVLLLENVRFHEGETKNSPEFAQALVNGAAVYVNDAFATAHRAHASTAAITEHFSVKAGGLTMKNELEYFQKAFSSPARPLAAIFGGAKISTKLGAIQHVAKTADKILVGGAMANTFFVAQGHSIGKSLYEEEQVAAAKECINALQNSNCELILPSDVVIAPELKAGALTQTVAIDAIPDDQMALDIGPQSLELFQQALQSCKTIVWNGPMGAFETADFASGTFGIVDCLANLDALSVVGGGDTDLALHQRHAYDQMSYVSTAGGAFLTLLEGKELPAVKALES